MAQQHSKPPSTPPENNETEVYDNLDSENINRLHSRSPHPYHRLKAELAAPTTSVPSRPHIFRNLPPSESGTEADDENEQHEETEMIIRALPAPPFRPRKGLQAVFTAKEDGKDNEALGTEKEEALEGEVFRLSDVGIHERMMTAVVGRRLRKNDDDGEATAVLIEKGKEVEGGEKRKRAGRRRAEILRRVLEGALVGVLGLGTLGVQGDGVWWMMTDADRFAVVMQMLLLTGIYGLYPVRLAWYSWNRGGAESFWRCMRISAMFDPAPYIYPTLLPVIVSLSLFPQTRNSLSPNLVLGLSSIPAGILSLKPTEIVNPFHWIISLIPSLLQESFNQQNDARREMLSILYPFHAYLVISLYSFTTTSLLPAELELLSISLLNILFLSTSPVSKIMSTILWIGGLGVLLSCTPFIKWGVALARIPRWRLKRTGRFIQARQSFIKLLNQALQKANMRTKSTNREIVESDADDDEVVHIPPVNSHLQALKLEVITTLKQNFFPSEIEEDETRSAVEKPYRPTYLRQTSSEVMKKHKRRHTLPSGTTPVPQSPQDEIQSVKLAIERRRRRRRRLSASTSYFLSLTYEQAVLRKWVYAAVVYFNMILLILLPIRYLVSTRALSGAEPFGWAIGYLFGDLRDVRLFVVTSPLLSSWIPLPELKDNELGHLKNLGRIPFLTEYTIGSANTRLLLSAWCLSIMASGLIAVLTLDFVEVDTRRKVFHGMMVAMLLPTTFVDPNFIALALAIVLAIFLILDLLRAAQVPPLSKPIAQFLTPYVDGRDLRGPVVISHVFLLIGCAVPLWLSLAGAQPDPMASDENIWRGWTVENRDVSMVAGVICVGMGDAMASLIGRRYGRHKWPWSGGKSLEGSAAFAGAVTLGLLASKAWLDYGQWNKEPIKWNWTDTLFKSVIASCATSGMEAALTGGNDNVVVPIVLWVFLRILGV